MRIERCTTEAVVSAYREMGSVWKAGHFLGISGQRVWQRLKLLGYPLPTRHWTREELAELEELARRYPLGVVARRLGRSYASVACKVSRLNFPRAPRARKIRRGSGLTKKAIPAIKRDVIRLGSIRKTAIARRTSVDMLAALFQKHAPEFWVEWAQGKGLMLKNCEYCTASFYPMTSRQQCCTRRCASERLRDHGYFGGKRRGTIGLAEKICQVCEQHTSIGISSHHVLGKENDPDNDNLVALCRGCHKLVTFLASRKFVDDEAIWTNLIHFVLMRRHGPEARSGPIGFEVSVDIDRLSAAEMEDELNELDERPEETPSCASSSQ